MSLQRTQYGKTLPEQTITSENQDNCGKIHTQTNTSETLRNSQPVIIRKSKIITENENSPDNLQHTSEETTNNKYINYEPTVLEPRLQDINYGKVVPDQKAILDHGHPHDKTSTIPTY
jgi:hypothetical protein